MKAMLIERIVSVASSDAPLMSVDPPVPEPGEHEIRNGVSVCGVCHAELDEIEGRLAPRSCPSCRAIRRSAGSTASVRR